MNVPYKLTPLELEELSGKVDKLINAFMMDTLKELLKEINKVERKTKATRREEEKK